MNKTRYKETHNFDREIASVTFTNL